MSEVPLLDLVVLDRTFKDRVEELPVVRVRAQVVEGVYAEQNSDRRAGDVGVAGYSPWVASLTFFSE